VLKRSPQPVRKMLVIELERKVGKQGFEGWLAGMAQFRFRHTK
jgi:hypothetical protein